MRSNYHTHSSRCGHAEGSGEDYVASALRSGFALLGFSDHAPYAELPPECEKGVRMPPELLPEYAAEVRELQARYAGRIELHLGVEAEYYPRQFETLLHELRANGVEYMILGQHFIGSGPGDIHLTRQADRKLLDRYVGQCVDAMRTGLFSYFAHPDIINFVGDDAEYGRQMRRLCVCARDCGLPMEINLLGLREERNYPNPSFWSIAAEEGCTVVLGWDAHAPWMLDVPETERSALELIERLGLRRVETVELRGL